jgi:hypothetical protein
MIFRFSKGHELGSKVGNLIFLSLYFREKSFHEFIGYLSDLLLHCEEYYDFIIRHQGRDQFLGVDDESLFTMLHLYRSCKFLAQYFDVKWTVIDLAEACKRDKEIWKGPYYLMHEMTISKILGDIQIVFNEIIQRAKQLVVNKQKDYWENINWPFYSMCLNLNIDQMKRKYEYE